MRSFARRSSGGGFEMPRNDELLDSSQWGERKLKKLKLTPATSSSSEKQPEAAAAARSSSKKQQKQAAAAAAAAAAAIKRV
ncbi:hypothetical protein Emed_005792 [Eimeria media]